MHDVWHGAFCKHCSDMGSVETAAARHGAKGSCTRAHLQASFHPVQLCHLEELGGLQGLEQVLLVLILGRPVVQLVEDEVLQELLVADADLHRMPAGLHSCD